MRGANKNLHKTFIIRVLFHFSFSEIRVNAKKMML